MLSGQTGTQCLSSCEGHMEESMAQTAVPRHEPLASPVSRPPRKRITTTDLMQGAREIIVLHHGEEYLLRITKSGKLILTK